MSADCYATDEGTYTVEVRSYETGKKLGELKIVGLKPREGLSVDQYDSEDSPQKEAL